MAFAMNLARVRAAGGQAALFLLAFVLGKGSAFFGPLLLSQIMTVQDYGTAELGLSIGVIGAQLLSLGVPGAIPQLVLIRKEDHAGIMDCYISRVVNGKLTLQKKVSKEDLLKNMPVRHNLSAMPV